MDYVFPFTNQFHLSNNSHQHLQSTIKSIVFAQVLVFLISRELRVPNVLNADTPITLPWIHVAKRDLGTYQGLAHPPATSTHSAKQDPCLPSTSTISVSHLHLHPTPFSLGVSHESQYSSSSLRFFSSTVVASKNGDLAN
jgi:hypothetical protein